MLMLVLCGVMVCEIYLNVKKKLIGSIQQWPMVKLDKAHIALQNKNTQTRIQIFWKRIIHVTVN